MTYAKTFAAIAATVFSAGVAALTGDNHISAQEWINVSIAFVAAVGVFYVPNAPNAPVAKAVVAALSAALALAVNFIVGGIDLSEWLQLALAALGAVGVYGVSNAPGPQHAA